MGLLSIEPSTQLTFANKSHPTEARPKRMTAIELKRLKLAECATRALNSPGRRKAA
jgi:hypothetical protein